jgi:CubicO group peptidase (beta-lactamase class C family)
VIEKISGKNFETLFAERIARPLDMKHTDFGNGKVPLPAGGAQSTPSDYLNFLVMIQNRGLFNGKRILRENSVAEMQINRVSSDVHVAYAPPAAESVKYGYGEWIMGPGIISSPGLFGSFPWVNNGGKYSGFLMAYSLNSSGRSERYKTLMALVDEVLNQPRSPTGN